MWESSFLKGRNYKQLLANLKPDKMELSKNFNRMSSSDFDFLLTKIEDTVAGADTNYQGSIPATVRLAITLIFLATGDLYASVMYLFRISKRSISKIIPEVCEAVEDALQEHFGGNFFPSIIFL